jgi:hypothetical protein
VKAYELVDEIRQRYSWDGRGIRPRNPHALMQEIDDIRNLLAYIDCLERQVQRGLNVHLREVV